MFDIVALGESLIDFTPSGENSQGMALFARNPGGAPANVLAMAAKLGGKTAFIGKVGDDAFGAFLKKTMEDAGVDVRGLRMTREYPTTLAFVQLTPEGDRSFTFYRKPGADVMLAPAEVDRALALESVVEPVSLYEPVYSDGGDTIYVMDQVGETGCEENWISSIQFRDTVSKLSDREKKIMSLRYLAGKTQVEVAGEIGISQAQVSRLEKNALERIKKQL